MPLGPRRVGRRGIVGVAATTAVVAGTAGAVHHRQEQRYAKKDAEAQAAAQQQAAAAAAAAAPPPAPAPVAPAPPPPPAAPAPAGSGNDLMAQLAQLSQMHESGVLSDEEFAAAKAKLLA